MQQDNLNLNEFQVSRVGERTERIRAIRRQRSQMRQNAEQQVQARSMTIKISLCTLVLLLVIGTEMYLLSKPAGQAVETSVTAEENEQEETLGRLKFVSLQETESVFSSLVNRTVMRFVYFSRYVDLLSTRLIPIDSIIFFAFTEFTLVGTITLNKPFATESVYKPVSTSSFAKSPL